MILSNFREIYVSFRDDYFDAVPYTTARTSRLLVLQFYRFVGTLIVRTPLTL